MLSFAGASRGRLTRIGLLAGILIVCAALVRLAVEATRATEWTSDASPRFSSNGTNEPSETPPFRPVRVVAERPPIVDAPFVHAREIRDQVTDSELVLGVVVEGAARAYPINMLTGPAREIMNDTLGGAAIAATW